METFAAVLLTVNIRHKMRASLRLTRSRFDVSMRLYDTARRAVVPFEPPPTVRMYVCGITPYDSTHLGHAATYLTYDLLIRRLEELGHEVRMVRNITDVDDSILPEGARARRPVPRARRGRDRRASTATWPRSRCARRSPSRARPSRSPQIIDLVGRLLDSGHAYLTAGTVYFDVSTFPRFGKLSHYPRRADGASSRARAAATPTTRTAAQPLDFVLWQPSLADEPAWRAPFGVGRPGWHIECSAMAMHEHGPTLDLHGGGTDLIFPHHECEIAQSESLTGEPLRGTGCTRRWSTTRARRCRSRSATSCSSATC